MATGIDKIIVDKGPKEVFFNRCDRRLTNFQRL